MDTNLNVSEKIELLFKAGYSLTFKAPLYDCRDSKGRAILDSDQNLPIETYLDNIFTVIGAEAVSVFVVSEANIVAANIIEDCWLQSDVKTVFNQTFGYRFKLQQKSWDGKSFKEVGIMVVHSQANKDE
jgi:hypothetical protein